MTLALSSFRTTLFSLALLAGFVLTTAGTIALADDHHPDHSHGHKHDHGHGPGSDDPHHGGLFFANPVITETPSPHSEFRLKYILEENNGGDAHTFEAGIELAFARWVSVEFVLPYVVLSEGGEHRSHTDSVELALKLATFAFEDRNLLLGGGLALELPTGDDDKGIGSDHVGVIEPYVTAGVRFGELAIVGRVAFGIPFNESSDERDEVDLELGYQVAALWHVAARVTLLLELDGAAILSGDEDEDVLNISPGIKLRPFDSDVELGAAVSFPLLDDPGFDVRFTFAVFLHF